MGRKPANVCVNAGFEKCFPGTLTCHVSKEFKRESLNRHSVTFPPNTARLRTETPYEAQRDPEVSDPWITKPFPTDSRVDGELVQLMAHVLIRGDLLCVSVIKACLRSGPAGGNTGRAEQKSAEAVVPHANTNSSGRGRTFLLTEDVPSWP